MIDGFAGPFVLPVGVTFSLPGGLAGNSMVMQGFSFTFGPPATNGFFGATEAREVVFM